MWLCVGVVWVVAVVRVLAMCGCGWWLCVVVVWVVTICGGGGCGVGGDYMWVWCGW